MVQDRVDIGLAMQTYMMASLWTKGRQKFETFLPPWMREQLKTARTDDRVVSAFEQMLREAEEDADDLNANGRHTVPHQ